MCAPWRARKKAIAAWLASQRETEEVKSIVCDPREGSMKENVVCASGRAVLIFRGQPILCISELVASLSPLRINSASSLLSVPKNMSTTIFKLCSISKQETVNPLIFFCYPHTPHQHKACSLRARSKTALFVAQLQESAKHPTNPLGLVPQGLNDGGQES